MFYGPTSPQCSFLCFPFLFATQLFSLPLTSFLPLCVVSYVYVSVCPPTPTPRRAGEQVDGLAGPALCTWLIGTPAFPSLISAPGENLGSQQQLWQIVQSLCFEIMLRFFIFFFFVVGSAFWFDICSLHFSSGHPLGLSDFFFVLCLIVLLLGPIYCNLTAVKF